MKKLNTKGFTLIELLAVIVVLAIVMVIAVTSVLNSTRNAAVNSFNSSALSVADFVKQQEQLYSLGTGNAEPCYKTWRDANNTDNTALVIDATNAACFGLNTTDYDLATSTIKINKTNNGAASVEVGLCAGTNGKFANIATGNGITVETISSNGKCVKRTK